MYLLLLVKVPQPLNLGEPSLTHGLGSVSVLGKTENLGFCSHSAVKSYVWPWLCGVCGLGHAWGAVLSSLSTALSRIPLQLLPAGRRHAARSAVAPSRVAFFCKADLWVVIKLGLCDLDAIF